MQRLGLCVGLVLAMSCAMAAPFEGRHFSGEGDGEYLKLLDTCYQMLYPSPELQNIGMLYNPSWNGFVEGPTWGAWWVQNSYGPTYCGLPFFLEPYSTYVSNSQDLWFSQMGDGKRVGGGEHKWVAPDGCLCDAAAPGWIYYKQGDGRVDIHDWGMEFTAAGLLLQAEQLLISRDQQAIAHYLPMLRRCAAFIESRRDPANDCFLAGPAGNLLAPSYAGYKKPDGTYDKAYLTGLSVTYIAALDRLIELEKLCEDGYQGNVDVYSTQRADAVRGLRNLTTDEGYLIKSLDPDGTKHGVYGAEKHGYFEAICNHDAIAFRVVDDQQAQKIYNKIASQPGLRPHDVVITNYPGLDDLYVEPKGLWEFGRWVNGGHWTTCEARMILAYYRLGKYEDARRSMQHLLNFAKDFRFDNNLVDFGNAVYQPQQPINCVYDSWGAPTAMLRGLFEYLYQSDSLVLIPHVPAGITKLEQRFPVRFGDKRVFLSTYGTGRVAYVEVNGKPWPLHDYERVTLQYDKLPREAHVRIALGKKALPREEPRAPEAAYVAPPPEDPLWQVNTWWSNPLGNGRPVRIGADSTGKCLFVGDMRRVRLYQRALSAEEVAKLAAGPLEEGGEGLVADWLFDRWAGDTCPNPANPDLTPKVSGELAVVDAEDGKVARFDGKGFLEVPCDARLTLAEAYTLEAWIKPETLPDSGARIIDRVTAGVDDGYLLDTCPGNNLRFISERGHLGYGAQFQPGVWAHVVATYAEDGMRMFLNGKEVAACPLGTPPAADRYARLGVFYNKLVAADLTETFAAQQAKLAIMHLQSLTARLKLQAEGKLPALPPASQMAANKSYLEAADRLEDGLRREMARYAKSDSLTQQRIGELWRECTP